MIGKVKLLPDYRWQAMMAAREARCIPPLPTDIQIRPIDPLPPQEPIGCIVHETMTREEFARRYPGEKVEEKP